MDYYWKLEATWDARPEGASQISGRLERFLSLAMAVSANLGRWFDETDMLDDGAIGPAINDLPSDRLREKIEDARLKNDLGNPVEGFGYRPIFWNGQLPGLRTSLVIWAGNTDRSLLGTNSIRFVLESGLADHGLTNDDKISRYAAAIVRAWEPDCIVLFRTGSAVDQVPMSDRFLLDKMIWLGPDYRDKATGLGGEGITCEPLAGGLLFTRLHLTPLD